VSPEPREPLSALAVERRWGGDARPGAAALAIVRDPAGCLLLIRRTKPPYTGQWALPGGAWEFGESLAEAAAREVREETGLEARFLGLRAVLNERLSPGSPTAPGGHFIGFACDLLAEGTVVSSDEGEVRWFAPAEVESLARDAHIAATDHALLTRVPPGAGVYVEAELTVTHDGGVEVISLTRFAVQEGRPNHQTPGNDR
jgi:ADP-ribose pyrophosphatase YjhB (NUDIX family)